MRVLKLNFFLSTGVMNCAESMASTLLVQGVIMICK